jgi:transposase
MASIRNPKLNKELQEMICNLIKRGVYIEVACEGVGIGKSTFYHWLQRGEKEKSGIYVDFLDAIKKAEAEAHVMYLDIIRKAAPDCWQAAAWYLERKYPHMWGRRERQEGAPHTADLKETWHRILFEREDEA